MDNSTVSWKTKKDDDTEDLPTITTDKEVYQENIVEDYVSDDVTEDTEIYTIDSDTNLKVTENGKNDIKIYWLTHYIFLGTEVDTNQIL